MTTRTEQAVRAWVRLDAAFAAVNATLVADHGVTGAQLAMLRLVDEWGGAVALADVRSRLSLHPATAGQLFARLAAKRLLDLDPDPADRRRRTARLTDHGRALLATAPLVGPVRLRHEPPDRATLDLLTGGFDAAVDAFGLTAYAPPPATADGVAGTTERTDR